MHNSRVHIQFRTFASHTAKREFYGPSTSTRVAHTGSKAALKGSYLCHRGKKTGYSCGTVSSSTCTPTYSGACGSVACGPYFVYVKGSTLRQDHGDSGGPWVGGNLTYGIHKGRQLGRIHLLPNQVPPG